MELGEKRTNIPIIGAYDFCEVVHVGPDFLIVAKGPLLV
jgi:hypothetical protein